MKIESYNTYLLSNYISPSIILERGMGSFVWDTLGRKYIDFTTGIAANALGHCHPKWVERVHKQANRLVHCSNLYGNRLQAELAERIVSKLAPGKMLFCNSGAEANEALLKLTRLQGLRLSGEEGKRFRIVTAHNAFHGRTFGGMAATPMKKVQYGFSPMLSGFSYASLNDFASFEKQISPETAGILLEIIQGDGGLFRATEDFLKAIRNTCTEQSILMLLDEVQSGMGRTGKWFAFQHYGVEPDAVALAKGLGGGFPIGAIWVSDRFADLFTPGSHGTTFGGNPLACAAALATMDIIEEESLLENVNELASYWNSQLKKLWKAFPHVILEVRGLGFMQGLALKENVSTWIARLQEQGLLVPPASNDVMRILPPLNVTKEALDLSIEILQKTFSEG